MGCGSRIKNEVGRWDDDVIQPIKKTYNGEYLAEGLNSLGVISDGGLKEWNRVREGAELAAMAVGGVMLSPVTGGASLGMTYGALSGAGMAAINGGNYDDIVGAGRTGGKYGAISGAASMGMANLLGPVMPANITSGVGKYADIAANQGINQLQYGVAGYGGARGAGMSSDQSLMFGVGSGMGASYAGGASAGTMLGAAVGGYGMMQVGGGEQPPGGGGAGGNYQAPQSKGDPGAGTTNQNSGGKSVPQAQFLDGGGGEWGNSGVGGVFGGLDNLRNKDKFVNTEEIKGLYAQRGVGAFVK